MRCTECTALLPYMTGKSGNNRPDDDWMAASRNRREPVGESQRRIKMINSQKEIYETEMQLWYEDMIRAEMQGDKQEYDRCKEQYEAYRKLAKAA